MSRARPIIPPRGLSIAEKLDFFSMPEPNSGCWLWLGALSSDGYGNFHFGKACASAHKVAWELRHGPAPDGAVLCHKCDVRSCVNPDHLYLGTHKTNADDRSARNRGYIRQKTLSAETVLAIRGDGRPRRVLKALYGVSGSTIDKIRRRAVWANVTGKGERSDAF